MDDQLRDVVRHTLQSVLVLAPRKLQGRLRTSLHKALWDNDRDALLAFDAGVPTAVAALAAQPRPHGQFMTDYLHAVAGMAAAALQPGSIDSSDERTTAAVLAQAIVDHDPKVRDLRRTLQSSRNGERPVAGYLAALLDASGQASRAVARQRRVEVAYDELAMLRCVVLPERYLDELQRGMAEGLRDAVGKLFKLYVAGDPRARDRIIRGDARYESFLREFDAVVDETGPVEALWRLLGPPTRQVAAVAEPAAFAEVAPSPTAASYGAYSLVRAGRMSLS